MPHTSLSATSDRGEPERDAPGRARDQDLLVAAASTAPPAFVATACDVRSVRASHGARDRRPSTNGSSPRSTACSARWSSHADRRRPLRRAAPSPTASLACSAARPWPRRCSPPAPPSTAAPLAPHSMHAYFVQAGIADQRGRGRGGAGARRPFDGDPPEHGHAGRSHLAGGDRVVPREPRRARVRRSRRSTRRSPTTCRCCRTGRTTSRPSCAGTRPRWVDHPPPLDLRIGEAPTSSGDRPADGARVALDAAAARRRRRSAAPHRAARVRQRLPAARHGVPLVPGRDAARRVRGGERRPRALVPPPGALRPVAPAHAGDGHARRPPRAGPRLGARRGRTPGRRRSCRRCWCGRTAPRSVRA